MITGAARIAGVVGDPVAQSRSPLLHNHWLARHQIDGAYIPLPVAPADLASAIAGLRRAGFAGVNLTIPHKQTGLALCTTLDHTAKRAGAVNTLVFGPGGIHGSNTDGAGFLANLAAHGHAAGRPALLLGAGGAARAIAAALLDAGAAVSLANRSPGRADALRAAVPGVRLVHWEARAAALADHGLLVNTTALGMAGQPPLDLDLSRAPADMVVADIVYVPLKTALLTAARTRQLATVPGLGMLLHQAVPGFAAWFGVTPVVDRELYEIVAAGNAPA